MPPIMRHHQMEIFSASRALCAGKSPLAGEFPSQRLVTWSFDVFFDLRLSKCLSTQWRRRWLEMPSRLLWRTVLKIRMPCKCYATHHETSSNGNIFRVTGPLCGEITVGRWIPLTKASDVELWCFLWSTPEQMFEHTMETPVTWDAIALIMTYSTEDKDVSLKLVQITPFHHWSWQWLCVDQAPSRYLNP